MALLNARTKSRETESETRVASVRASLECHAQLVQCTPTRAGLKSFWKALIRNSRVKIKMKVKNKRPSITLRTVRAEDSCLQCGCGAPPSLRASEESAVFAARGCLQRVPDAKR